MNETVNGSWTERMAAVNAVEDPVRRFRLANRIFEADRGHHAELARIKREAARGLAQTMSIPEIMVALGVSRSRVDQLLRPDRK